jgi:hypothetical protein
MIFPEKRPSGNLLKPRGGKKNVASSPEGKETDRARERDSRNTTARERAQAATPHPGRAAVFPLSIFYHEPASGISTCNEAAL